MDEGMKKRLVPALSSIGQRVCNPLAVVLPNMFQGTGPVTENMKSICSGTNTRDFIFDETG
jgi:hypothetical protein